MWYMDGVTVREMGELDPSLWPFIVFCCDGRRCAIVFCGGGGVPFVE